jgi:hypothetical protein
VRVRQQVAPVEPLALVERLQDQRFFLRSHAAQRSDAAVGAARSRSSSVRMPSSRYKVATVLGPTPCRWSRSRIVGGNSATSSRWYAVSPVRAILDGSAPRGPCRCREFPAGRSRPAGRDRAGDWTRCRRHSGTRGS